MRAGKRYRISAQGKYSLGPMLVQRALKNGSQAAPAAKGFVARARLGYASSLAYNAADRVIMWIAGLSYPGNSNNGTIGV